MHPPESLTGTHSPLSVLLGNGWSTLTTAQCGISLPGTQAHTHGALDASHVFKMIVMVTFTNVQVFLALQWGPVLTEHP